MVNLIRAQLHFIIITRRRRRKKNRNKNHTIFMFYEILTGFVFCPLRSSIYLSKYSLTSFFVIFGVPLVCRRNESHELNSYQHVVMTRSYPIRKIDKIILKKSMQFSPNATHARCMRTNYKLPIGHLFSLDIRSKLILN